MLALETLDDLKQLVSKEIGVSEWLTISQARIDRFAEVTEDCQWIHVDRERAKRESPFGTTVAHGFLTLSLLSHLLHQAVQLRHTPGTTINYGLNRVRFPAPVREGSKIRGRFTLLSFSERSDAHEAIFGCSVECDGSDKPCCVAEWVVRYYK